MGGGRHRVGWCETSVGVPPPPEPGGGYFGREGATRSHAEMGSHFFAKFEKEAQKSEIKQALKAQASSEENGFLFIEKNEIMCFFMDRHIFIFPRDYEKTIEIIRKMIEI